MNKTLKALLDQNDVAEMKLAEDSRAAVEKMASYMHASRMGAVDRELVRRDMIAMAMEAQERGEPFSSVIGPDQKAWCDAVSESAGRAAPAEKLFRFLFRSGGCGTVFCLIAFLEYIKWIFVPTYMYTYLLVMLLLVTVAYPAWHCFAPRLNYCRLWKRCAAWALMYGVPLLFLYFIPAYSNYTGRPTNWFSWRDVWNIPLFVYTPALLIAFYLALFLIGWFGNNAYIRRQVRRLGLTGGPARKGAGEIQQT